MRALPFLRVPKPKSEKVLQQDKQTNVVRPFSTIFFLNDPFDEPKS